MHSASTECAAGWHSGRGSSCRDTRTDAMAMGLPGEQEVGRMQQRCHRAHASSPPPCHYTQRSPSLSPSPPHPTPSVCCLTRRLFQLPCSPQSFEHPESTTDHPHRKRDQPPALSPQHSSDFLDARQRLRWITIHPTHSCHLHLGPDQHLPPPTPTPDPPSPPRTLQSLAHLHPWEVSRPRPSLPG